ncbi:hypothetical protein MSPP1_001570 [Malassezia sp. CBS 17886]|nr:hypothetical protein MSPP1_001570 [Malassezia sp. CBS 17886]
MLWSKSFTPSVPTTDVVNRVVNTAFLEERTAAQRTDVDGYTVCWSFANRLDLAFLAVHQRILQLHYVDDLLAAVQELFTKRYASLLHTLPSMRTDRATLCAYAESLDRWAKEFAATLRRCEHLQSRRPLDAKGVADTPTLAPQQDEAVGALAKPGDVRGVDALRGRKAAVVRDGRRAMGKGRKATSAPKDPATATAKASQALTKGSQLGKERRRWNGGEAGAGADEMTALDFSGAGGAESSADLAQWIDESKLGQTRTDGVYELADDADDDAADDADDADDAPPRGFFSLLPTSARGRFSWTGLVGGTDALTAKDLEPVLHAMQTHLQSKNVANEVAEMICQGVQRRLVGKRLGSFRSVKTEVRSALDESITRILTPSTSTDILLEIASKKQRRAELHAAVPAHAAGAAARAVNPALNPYAMCFVGVNGVGKSTNLAKVCFWLLQNRYRVLIAACDTFRSGAVEQLRTHVQNLGMLDIDGRPVRDGTTSGASILELYERGYGKDAAGIAKEALAYARTHGFDVVLIDTAGRMQDNEPLMRALAKLIAVNQPDKVLFVGEALVGNEAVDQLTKFNRAVKDYSGVASPRGLDGCLLTKWDTVDDKVGTALTSTWATGLPIFFVGTGQTYTDLRQLRVHHVVNALLRE